jgi:hypothetical protein
VLLDSPTSAAVFRLRPRTTTDSYGDPVASWDDPERARLRGAQLQATGPGNDEEESPSGNASEDHRRLIVPGTPSLTETDRIEADGEVWRIDGTPVIRRGIASSAYTTAELRRPKVKEPSIG